MLETIIEWIMSGIANLMEVLCSWIIENLQVDIGVIADTFPIFVTAYSILQSLALAFVVLIAAFQLFNFFKGDISDVKDTPVTIVIRSIIAVAAIYYGGYLLEAIVNFAKLPYDAMADLDAVEAMSWNWSILATVGGSTLLGGVFELGAIATILLALIMVCTIAMKILHFAMEMFQRFVMVGVLLFASPLAFSTIASKNTGEIFKKYLNMFITQCLLMTLTVWMLKAIMSAFSFDPANEIPYFFKWLCALALCQIAERLDTYLNQLGLNSVTTGGRSILDSLSAPLTAMAMRSTGSKSSVLGGDGGSGSKGLLGGIVSHANSHGMVGGVAAGAKAAKNSFLAGGNGSDAKQAFGQAWRKAADPLQTNPYTRVKDKVSQARKTNATAAAEKNQTAYAEYQKAHGKGTSMQDKVTGAAAATKDATGKYSNYFQGAGSVTPKNGSPTKGNLDRNATGAGLTVASASKASPAGTSKPIGSNGHGESAGAGKEAAANAFKDSSASGGGSQPQRLHAEVAGSAYDMEADPSQYVSGSSSAVSEFIGENYSGSAENGEGFQQLLANSIEQQPGEMAEATLMDRDYDLLPGQQMEDGSYTNDCIGSKLVESAYGTDGVAEGSIHNVSAVTEQDYRDEISGQWVAGGRYVNYDYESPKGDQMHREVVDQMGYENMRPAAQKEFKEFKTRSGETAYERVSSNAAKSKGPSFDNRTVGERVSDPSGGYRREASWAEKPNHKTSEVASNAFESAKKKFGKQ